jgi:hypothetical protein
MMVAICAAPTSEGAQPHDVEAPPPSGLDDGPQHDNARPPPKGVPVDPQQAVNGPLSAAALSALAMPAYLFLTAFLISSLCFEFIAFSLLMVLRSPTTIETISLIYCRKEDQHRQIDRACL